MTRISLTVWFGDEKDRHIKTAYEILGHLTEEQYDKALEWICRMFEWTNENMVKMEESE